MKVYAARDYVDDTARWNNTVEVNIPEYMPTVPQDDKSNDIIIESGYFLNSNYPVTQDLITAKHYLTLPLLAGTYAPVRFHKGAEFVLHYPTGKVEEGYLIFIKDKNPDEDKEGET
ncbi:hypothetical protein [uncultured Duncaniella sp.]|uniref:hypothetical protein n=1 Tax=uncultured Duncaniella sp. TaxID=2768039 RepID=UPI002633C1BD|nr:hypothetical protein [uncultured Duncaniella sp.]